MDKPKAKMLISILMESTLYLTMSPEERARLLARLTNDYPDLFNCSHNEEIERL